MPHFLIKTKSDLADLSPTVFDRFSYKNINYTVKNRWRSSTHTLWEVFISGKRKNKTIFVEQKSVDKGFLFKIYKPSKPEIDDGIKRFLLFFAKTIVQFSGGKLIQNNLTSSDHFEPLIDSEYEISGAVSQCIDWKEEFGSDKNIIVEIGFGRGDFLLRLRNSYPECNIIGIETQAKSVYLAKRKLSRADASSVKLINLNAISALSYLFKPASISKIFINFPVPWPKKRQANKRLINKEFSRIAFCRLKSGGTISLVTDSKDYFDASIEFLAQAGFLACAVENIYETEKIGTKYEDKWLNQGKNIHICSMRKPASSENSSINPELIRKGIIQTSEISMKLKDSYSSFSADKSLYVIDVLSRNLSERIFFSDKLLNVSTFIMLAGMDELCR